LDVIMPQLGETVAEGTVAAWHKKEGDQVAIDELLVEIETDKVATEVPSLVAGTLRKILVSAGETVKVGTTLAIIESGDGAGASMPKGADAPAAPAQVGRSAALDAGASPAVPGSEGRGAPLSLAVPSRDGSGLPLSAAVPSMNGRGVPLSAAAPSWDGRGLRPSPAVPNRDHGVPPSPIAPSRDGQRLLLSPAVRKLIAVNRLDVTRIRGTGRGGRIKRNDVLSHLEEHRAPSTSTRGRSEIVPFSALRKRIAEHMVRSKATSAHVLQAVEVDFSGVETARAALRKAWKEREGASLTYLPFVARAVSLALPEFPHLNAHVSGDSLAVYEAINLSIAVDLDRGGLVAPVIKNAAAMRVPELARAITKIAERARAYELKPDDVTEGTYSLTNNGSFGTFITAPVINQPQVAILSIDGVHRRPWVIADDKGERIEIRPVGVLAQSFDHRAVDGAYSGAYLRRVKQILELHEWIGEFLG
jgi:pyruvate dehydrogenase E2 component (dihydrolipoamide acetyltransferase)